MSTDVHYFKDGRLFCWAKRQSHGLWHIDVNTTELRRAGLSNAPLPPVLCGEEVARSWVNFLGPLIEEAVLARRIRQLSESA